MIKFSLSLALLLSAEANARDAQSNLRGTIATEKDLPTRSVGIKNNLPGVIEATPVDAGRIVGTSDIAHGIVMEENVSGKVATEGNMDRAAGADDELDDHGSIVIVSGRMVGASDDVEGIIIEDNINGIAATEAEDDRTVGTAKDLPVRA